ncbi:MAG: hypothetical protein OEY15_11095 [Myxococcales bacterium]|nr:hypothetical protein [Myxococcales bacterium]
MALDPLVPGDGPFMDFDMVLAEAAQQYRRRRQHVPARHTIPRRGGGTSDGRD